MFDYIVQHAWGNENIVYLLLSILLLIFLIAGYLIFTARNFVEKIKDYKYFYRFLIYSCVCLIIFYWKWRPGHSFRYSLFDLMLQWKIFYEILGFSILLVLFYFIVVRSPNVFELIKIKLTKDSSQK